MQALVICILRPQVPLDYYYFEHCRELVQFSPETLDDVPLRTDNPFLVERHAPAAIQDYLIGAEEGAKLIWNPGGAARLVETNREEIQQYLNQVFIRSHSWDVDLINNAIEQGIDRALSVLKSRSITGWTNDRLSELIQLSVRATDIAVPIDSEDFDLHRGISLSGELAEEEFEDLVEHESGEEPDQ